MFGDFQAWYTQAVFCFLLNCCTKSTQWSLTWGTPGLNLSENKHEFSKGHPGRIHSLCVLLCVKCQLHFTVTELNHLHTLIWRSFVSKGAGLFFHFCDFAWRRIHVGDFKLACMKTADRERVRLLALQSFAVPSQTGLPGLHLDAPSWVEIRFVSFAPGLERLCDVKPSLLC